MTTDTGHKTEQMKEEGKHLTDEARSRGEQVGQQAKEEMGHVLDDARSKARHQAEDQAHRAAGALRGMADQLNSMADGSDEQGFMVDMAHNGASRIRRFADHVDEAGVDGIVNDVQGFARRRPGAFIAAGLGVGMLMGRFLRATDTDSMREAITGDGGESMDSEPSSSGIPSESARSSEPASRGYEPIAARGAEGERSI